MLRLVTAAAFVSLALAEADAATLKVPQQFATIQLALIASQPGDTVLVKAGTYFETVSITTAGVHLKAQGKVIVDALAGGVAHGPAIVIQASAVGARITGLTVRHARTSGLVGVGVQSKAPSVVLTKLHVIACESAGIWLGGAAPIVRQCIVEGCSGGLEVNAPDATIESNVVQNDGVIGIDVTTAGNNGTVRNNRIGTIAYSPGILVNADSVHVVGNHIENIPDGSALALFGKQNEAVGNRIRAIGSYDVAVLVAGSQNVLRGNRITDCEKAGILVDVGAVDTLLEQNVLERCGTGSEPAISLIGTHATANKNVVRAADGNGIHVESVNAVVSANQILNCNTDGIHLNAATGGVSIDHNVCKNNLGEGVDLRSIPAVFKGNVLKGNRIDLAKSVMLTPDASNVIGSSGVSDID